MRVKEKISADPDQVLVLSPDFFSYIHQNWTQNHGRYPSTGLTAVIYALHTCDQVSVFGFGADSEGNWHHYWGNKTDSPERLGKPESTTPTSRPRSSRD
ncbi:hypothetical protein WMY93_032311 [Mugilogobius chulae]|uniref:Uncharacterized protein n=1 Tax=Mugilogobius chulae TaxID=88201 RepID=A0AAW0MK34_9GOBI